MGLAFSPRFDPYSGPLGNRPAVRSHEISQRRVPSTGCCELARRYTHLPTLTSLSGDLWRVLVYVLVPRNEAFQIPHPRDTDAICEQVTCNRVGLPEATSRTKAVIVCRTMHG